MRIRIFRADGPIRRRLTDHVRDSRRDFIETTIPYLDVVYRVARHACRDHQSAEDLVQETYLRAFAAFDSHSGASTKAWLITICLNLSRSEGRRKARRVIETQLFEFNDPVSNSAPVAEAVLAKIDRESISRSLAQIPYEQRLAIVLMDLAGHTASEVAAILGCSRNTVLSRVHRGRKRLASLLVEEDVNRDLF